MNSIDALQKEDLEEIPSLVILCAVSYAVGRRTYIVGVITDFLKNRWSGLSPRVQRDVQDQIRAAKERDDRTPDHLSPLGDECDRRDWLEILNLPISTDD